MMFAVQSSVLSGLSRQIVRSSLPSCRSIVRKTPSSSLTLSHGGIALSSFSSLSSLFLLKPFPSIFPFNISRYNYTSVSSFQNISTLNSESKLSSYYNLPVSSTRSLTTQSNKKKKSGSKKQKERVAKKNKTLTASTGTTKSPSVATNTQNEEWVNFQQSISVQGFNTGQSTAISSASRGVNKKNRGGSGMRKRREKEMEMLAAESTTSSSNPGTGQFPALRYSDEETQKLLAEAYANLPKRTGKRGTRNLKRQRNRWAIVRKNRWIQKQFIHRAHYRRMEKRSRIVREVLSIKAEAETVRVADRVYQEQVLKKWIEIMKSHNDGKGIIRPVQESLTSASV